MRNDTMTNATATTASAPVASAPRRTHSSVHGALTIIGGVGAMAAALLANWAVRRPFHVGKSQAIVLAIGGGIAVVGGIWKDRPITRLLSTLVLAGLACAFVLLAAELAFRAIGYDFSKSEATFNAYPSYYRWPTV